MKKLFQITLRPNSSSNRVIHSNQVGILPEPYALEIVQFKEDSGFYLLYLDKNGEEQTDTYHENLNSAFEQAEFEFGVKISEWQQA